MFMTYGPCSSKSKHFLTYTGKIHRSLSTIFALSSGQMPSAIAVIRISGDKSEFALQHLTRQKRVFKHRQLFYTPFFNEYGRLLDRGMACFMRAPKTFSGEDSAELYLHGSRAVVQSVCATLAKIPGLESAKAGEFTRRAYFNGKLDATQVEALGDLLHAETDAQLRLSHAQAKVGEYLKPTRESLVQFLAKMEARIDFAEDLEDAQQTLEEEFKDDIDMIAKNLHRFLCGAERGQLIRSGLRVALVGRPNVGKSSMMNKLAVRDLAIVSDISGTTRDCLETRLHLNGQLVILTDTAGIREQPQDPLEREGIRRTLLRAAEAHLVLLVLDPTQLMSEDGLASLLMESGVEVDRQQLIVCVNKSDLVEDPSKRTSLEQALKSINFPVVWTCCVREDGLDQLVRVIGEQLDGGLVISGEDALEGSEVFLSRERHIQCLKRALLHLERVREALAMWDDPAMAALSLRLCVDAVGEISGTVVHDEVLDNIFSQFCIGK